MWAMIEKFRIRVISYFINFQSQNRQARPAGKPKVGKSPA